MKFAGKDVLRTEIASPPRGRLRAQIVTEEKPAPAGALAWDDADRGVQCAVLESTPERGLWTTTIFAGTGGWSRPVDAQHFLGPLPRAEVVRSVAARVGERVDTTQLLDSVDHYLLPSGPATTVLDGLPWYVDEAGITVVGAERKGKHRDVTIATTDLQSGQVTGSLDGILLVGDTINVLDGSTSRLMRVLEVTQDGAGAFVARVGGASAQDALRGLLRASDEPSARRYFATGAELHAPAGSSAPPVLRGVPRWIGPGHTAELAPATPLLVACADGDRTRPVVVAVAGEPMPIRLTWSAATSVRLASPRVEVGPTGAIPVAMAPGVVAALTALGTALQAQASALTAVGAVPLTASALAPMFAAINAALSAAMSATPISSTSLGAD